MENIADALRMAAGVMIALLLMSLLVYTFNIINKSEDARADQKLIEESKEFNKKFLAFDKSSMYGTDLISILGLAISNNETYKQRYQPNPDGSYDENIDGTINIKFTLGEEDVTAITRVYNYKKDQWNSTSKRYDVKWEEDSSKTTIEPILEGGNTYSLDSGPKFDLIRTIAIDGNSKVEVKTKGTVRTVRDKSGFNELKKRIFECTDIRYNQTGKINFMSFKEKEDI